MNVEAVLKERLSAMLTQEPRAARGQNDLRRISHDQKVRPAGIKRMMRFAEALCSGIGARAISIIYCEPRVQMAPHADRSVRKIRD
jgi:hypothetical protein